MWVGMQPAGVKASKGHRGHRRANKSTIHLHDVGSSETSATSQWTCEVTENPNSPISSQKQHLYLKMIHERTSSLLDSPGTPIKHLSTKLTPMHTNVSGAQQDGDSDSSPVRQRNLPSSSHECTRPGKAAATLSHSNVKFYTKQLPAAQRI